MLLAPQYNTKSLHLLRRLRPGEDLLIRSGKVRWEMSAALRVFTVLATAEEGWGIEKDGRFHTQAKKTRDYLAKGS